MTEQTEPTGHDEALVERLSKLHWDVAEKYMHDIMGIDSIRGGSSFRSRWDSLDEIPRESMRVGIRAVLDELAKPGATT